MENLIKLVQEWANDKGLNKPEQLKVQALKVLEEMGEMNAALLRINKEGERFIQMPKLIDGIGDLQVTLIVLSGMKGINYSQIVTTSLTDKFAKEDAHDWALNIASWFMVSLDVDITDTRFCFFFSAIKGAIIELCRFFELTPQQCLQAAYDEIKERTGMLVNGTFIKDETKPSEVDLSELDYDDIVVFKNGFKLPITYIETDLDNADYDYKIKVKNTSGIHSAHLIGSMLYTKNGVFDIDGKITEWNIVQIIKA